MKVKRARQYFEKAERDRLNWIINHSTNLFYSHNLDGELIYLSPQIEQMLGYTQEEGLKNWQEFITDNIRNKKALELTQRAITTGETQEPYLLELRRKDGDRIWVEVHEAPVIEDDKVKYITGSLTEVTDRIHQDRLQKLISSLSSSMIETDDMQTLLNRMQKVFHEIIDARNFFAVLINEENGKLTFPYFKNDYEESPVTVDISNSLGITPYIMKSGKNKLLIKSEILSLNQEGKIVLGGAIPEEWIGIPLKTGEKVFGLISFQRFANQRKFELDEFRLLDRLSGSISLIIRQRQIEMLERRGLREKETLLRELYHRTNNNMQIIESIILQKAEAEQDVKIKDSYQEIVDKIYSMSLVHKKLYQIRDLSELSLDSYIGELYEQLSRQWNRKQKKSIILEKDLQAVKVSVDLAIPLGLILTELISNAYRHAFVGVESGRITIILKQNEAGFIVLRIVDNGCGISEGTKLENLKTSGLITVFSIVNKQLKGSVTYKNRGGLDWEIIIPINKKFRVNPAGNYQEETPEIQDLKASRQLQKMKLAMNAMQNQLEESEATFKKISDTSPLAIMIYQNDKWIYANKAAERISGYNQEELLDMNYWGFVHPDYVNKVTKAGKKRQQNKQTEQSYEFKIIAKDGQEKWVWLNGGSIKYKGVPAGIITVHDITELKSVEKRLRESEERFKFLTNATFEGIVVHKNGRVIDVNEAFLRITGYSREEVLNQKFLDYIPLIRDRAKILFNVSKQTAKPYVIKARRKDGSYFPAELEATNVKRNGKTVRIAALRDITARLQQAEELQRAHERLRTMNSILRHDIANDLSVMESALELFKETSDYNMLIEVDKRLHKCIQVIKDQQNNEIYNVNRGKAEGILLNDLLAIIRDDYPEIEIEIDLGDNETVEVIADQRINSVFENLINNSIRHGRATKIRIQVFVSGGICKVDFCDNGTGIIDEIKPYIFDEGYHSGSTGNTGLGLYIVKSIIEDLGGSIKVINNYPDGTKFEIELVAVNPEQL